MGYCIEMRSANFLIRKENEDAALDAVKKLGNGSNDDRAHGGGMGRKWFSWMNNANPNDWDTLKDAMKAWRYPIKKDESGNWGKISFDGEKIGQEDLLFNTLAPFVEPGSVITMEGEDGSVWHWEFDGKTCKEVAVDKEEESKILDALRRLYPEEYEVCLRESKKR